MKKNLIRLLIALVCVFAAWQPLAVQAQKPIEGGGDVVSLPIDSHALSFDEAKAKEPRLMSEAETAKVFAPIDPDYLAKQSADPDIEAKRQLWHRQHDESLAALNKSIPAQPKAKALPAEIAPEVLPAPIQGHAAKTLQKPAVYQMTPKTINVIIIQYLTVVTGQSDLPTVVQYQKDAVVNGSKFQGTGPAGVSINMVATYTVNGAAPTLNFPQPGVIDEGKYTKFMDMASIYSTYNLCNQFKAGTLDQVWIWSDGWSAPNQMEMVVNGSDWAWADWLTNAPKCGRAGVAFSFVYANSPNGSTGWYPALLEQAPHSYVHYIEYGAVESKQWDYSVCDFVDGQGRPPSGITGDTRYATAYCPSRPLSNLYGFTAHPNAGNGNVGMCGDNHLPPNITTLAITTTYDYDNPATVQSRCNTWQWGVNTTPQSISCSAWQCHEYWYMVWWMQRLPSATTNATDRWGANRLNFWYKFPSLIPKSDVITRNDYNFDKKTDFAIFRPSDGKFYVKYSGVAGNTGSPVPCLFANSIPRTGKLSNNSNYWLVYQTSTGKYYEANGGGCTNFQTLDPNLNVGSAKFSYVTQTVQSDGWRHNPATGGWTIALASGASGPFPANFSLGATGSVAVIADYDGDGIMDPATYKSSTGAWSIWNSGSLLTTTLTWANSANFIPVVADYDGDKKADVAVYDTVYHTWYIRQTVSGQTISVNWGANGDIPVPADYDGDGYANVAIFRPSTGDWGYLKRDGSDSWTQYGGPGDIPISGWPW